MPLKLVCHPNNSRHNIGLLNVYKNVLSVWYEITIRQLLLITVLSFQAYAFLSYSSKNDCSLFLHKHWHDLDLVTSINRVIYWSCTISIRSLKFLGPGGLKLFVRNKLVIVFLYSTPVNHCHCDLYLWPNEPKS